MIIPTSPFLPTPNPLFQRIFDWLFGDNIKKEKERQKKAALEREKQIELEKQAEEKQRQARFKEQEDENRKQAEWEKQRQDTIQKQKQQAEQEQREREKELQGDKQRAKIYKIATSFTSKTLYNITMERVQEAGNNLEKLHVIYSEAMCAQGIDTCIYAYRDMLIFVYYYEIMIEQLHTAYRAHDIKKLEEIKEEVTKIIKRMRPIYEPIQKLVRSIKSHSLSETLQKITDKMIEKAVWDIDELEKINEAASCACEIEQRCIELDKYGYQNTIRERLESAYQDSNLDELREIAEWAKKESEQLQPFYDLIQSIKSYSPIRQEIHKKIEVAYQNRNLEELEAILSEVQQSKMRLSRTQTESRERETVLSKFNNGRYDNGLGVHGD